ncbi:MAG: hypothetical protein FWG77_10890 [Treponema sp.]|nr:hypothetical protein [Treponema sp.]
MSLIWDEIKNDIFYEGIYMAYDYIIRKWKFSFQSNKFNFYVNIPKGHKFYRKDYSDKVYSSLNSKYPRSLSFSGTIKENDDWWIGWEIDYVDIDDDDEFDPASIFSFGDCPELINLISTDYPSYIFDLKPLKASSFSFSGQNVDLIILEKNENIEVYEILTNNYKLGINTEKAWINYLYPGYKLISSTFERINLNNTDIPSHLWRVIVENCEKYIFFSIYYYPYDDDDYEVRVEEDKESLLEPKLGAFNIDKWWRMSFTISERTILRCADVSIIKKDYFSIQDLRELFDNNQLGYDITDKIGKKIIEFSDPEKNFNTICHVHNYYGRVIKSGVEEKNEKRNSLTFIIPVCLSQIEMANKYVLALKAIKYINFDKENSKNLLDRMEDYFKIGRHEGYERLALAYFQQGKYNDSIKIAQEAKDMGWSGHWDNRINAAQTKLKKIERRGNMNRGEN